MTPRTQSAWRAAASAVEHITAIERAGLTVWNVVTEALDRWLEPDCLRGVVIALTERLSAVGAPGGADISNALDAAMSEWRVRETQFTFRRE